MSNAMGYFFGCMKFESGGRLAVGAAGVGVATGSGVGSSAGVGTASGAGVLIRASVGTSYGGGEFSGDFGTDFVTAPDIAVGASLSGSTGTASGESL